MAPWPMKELSLIRQGLSEFMVKSSDQSTEVINLHGNCLLIIPADLNRLTHLRELDLSSNRIEIMEGLDSLCSLQYLNLSCNFIKKVQGLSSLKSLLRINLSHNQIEDLGGFKDMEGKQGYALTVVDLCDNKIAALSHVVSCLRKCTNLRYLVLHYEDGLSNPVCRTDNYRVRLLSRLSHLSVLDCVSRDGQRMNINDLQVAELNTPRMFMSLNLNDDDDDDDDDDDASCEDGDTQNGEKSSSSQTSKAQSDSSCHKNSASGAHHIIQEMSTPHIDEMIEKYRERNGSEHSSDSRTNPDVGVDVSRSSDLVGINSSENQFALMRFSLDSDLSKSPSKVSSASKSKSTPPKKKKDSSPHTSKHSKTTHTSSPVHKKGGKTVKINPAKTTRQKVSSRTTQVNSSNDSLGARVNPKSSKSQIASCNEVDHEYRNMIEATYSRLIEELNEERVERVKAEEAVKEMTGFVNEIQENMRKKELRYESALQENTFLKESVAKEKEVRKKVEGDLLLAVQDNADLENKLKAMEKGLQNQKALVESLKSSSCGTEQQYLKELADEQKSTKKYQLLAAASSKEAKEFKTMASFLQKKIKEFEGLLAVREMEHKEDIKDRYKLGSDELKLVIDDKLKDLRKQYEERMKLQEERAEMAKKRYEETASELNYALKLESGQVNKLEAAYEAATRENELNKKAVAAVRAKDKKMVDTLTQLTNVVKKQKEQISELVKSKQELVAAHGEETKKMEAHMNEMKKNLSHLGKLKQDRLKLEAQVEAQESLIVGLRAERKVWENELAQQGTALAQDRGRLDVKIETLSTEVDYLKKQLKTEVDTLKIKSKVIDDQSDTINSLKTELLQKDQEIREIKEDAVQSKKKMEDEMVLEQDELQEYRLTIEKLQGRKSELKEQVSQLEAELRESKNAHHILKEHWRQKSDVINSLEVQVRQAKNVWEKKEAELRGECEKAQKMAKDSGERWKKADDAFRRQIIEKEKGQQVAIAQIHKDHRLELDLANQKIISLEEEMRIILKDSNKMQEKMMKLADFFGNVNSKSPNDAR